MSAAAAGAGLTAKQHGTLHDLLVAAKIDRTIDDIVADFKRPKPQPAAAEKHLSALIKRLGAVNVWAGEPAKLYANARKLTIHDLCKFLDLYGQLYDIYLANEKAKKLQQQRRAAAGSLGNESAADDKSGKNPADVPTRSWPANWPDRHHVADNNNAAASASTENQKFLDMRRRIAEAANDGLSEAARSSHIGAGDWANRNIEGADVAQLLDANTAGGGGGSTDAADAFGGLRRRQKLWHINIADAVQFQHQNAAALPARSQERLLIDEVLSSLLGIGGTFVRATLAADGSNVVRFVVSEQIDGSLRDLCGRILLTGTHFTIVDDFCVQQCNEYHAIAQKTGAHQPSPVLHALSCALRNLLQSFERTVVQLEADADQLTLSKLQHMLRPSGRTMAVLAQVVQTIGRNGWRGAAVLNELHDEIAKSLGDEARQTVLEMLLEQAAVPYIRTLELWTVKGVIVDPHEEFMIEEWRLQTSEPEEESYWNNRYAMIAVRQPKFLASVASIVQRTGKYLNVIRQCGHSIAGPVETEREPAEPADEQKPLAPVFEGNAEGKHDGICGKRLRFSATCDEHLVFINMAYQHASQRLLELLKDDNDLMGHLASLKRYLLMQQGDFIEQFMDVVEEELSKNVDEALPIKLENLLGLVLRTTSAKDDKYMDQLRVEIYDCDLQTQMAQIQGKGRRSRNAPPEPDAPRISGFEGFSFDYVVQWPLSLVINHFSLTFYKTVFRLLFYFKHAQRQLGRMWIHNKNVKRFERRPMSDVQRGTFSLSHRMIHAVQSIEYYVMLEVVEPLWQEFLVSMAAVQNVDQVIYEHGNFTSALVERTMLRMPNMLKTLISLCRMCLDFAKMVMAHVEFRETEAFASKVAKCNEAFTALLHELLAKINGNPDGSSSNRYVNLVHRLNFNSFYSDKVDGHASARNRKA